MHLTKPSLGPHVVCTRCLSDKQSRQTKPPISTNAALPNDARKWVNRRSEPCAGFEQPHLQLSLFALLVIFFLSRFFFYPFQFSSPDLELLKSKVCRFLICNPTCKSPPASPPPSAVITASGPRSELTLAEHIAAISLARRMISRLVLLLRVLSCAAEEEGRRRGGGGERRRCRCRRRHMSPRFCHSPLELGRLPAVPCHSAWLETAGFHGGMFGCAGIEPSACNNII